VREAPDVLVVSVPGIPPGPNSRRHWSQRARDDAEWRRTGFLCAKDAINRGEASGYPWGRVRVRYVSTTPSRRSRDPDNLIGACKPLLDGLRDAGVIIDDSHEHVTIEPPEFRHGPRGVEIRVTRVVEAG
jgi:hypothetical protein